MSKHRHGSSSHSDSDVPRRPGEIHTSDAVQYDRDLNVRGILWTGVWLVLGTLATMLVSWWVFAGLRHMERMADPPPPAMPEVRQRHMPTAGPRLQADADQDMRELRAAEDRILLRPSWIDAKQGTVRLPIDLAIDVLARQGLPEVKNMPAQATPAPPAQATTGVPAPETATAAAAAATKKASAGSATKAPAGQAAKPPSGGSR
jgi:hypothetical protein